MKTQKLEEATILALQGKLTEDYNSVKYYHYDNRIYHSRDIVTKEYKFKYEEIVTIYKNILNIDVSNVVYMLDHIEKEYEDGTYQFRYEVKPLSDVVCGNLDYSAIMCDYFLEDNVSKFDLSNKDILTNIVTTFVGAYNGNEKDIKTLSEIFTPYTGRKEYITNKCEVVNVIRIL